MKEKVLALALSLCSIALVAQTPLPYSTGFDNDEDLETWMFAENGNICGPGHLHHRWDARIRDNAVSGPNVMHHDYEVGYDGEELTEDWVFSPNFDFGSGAEVSFKINVYAIAGIQPEDNIEIYLIKTDGIGTILEYTLLESLRDLCSDDYNTYNEVTVGIPPTEGVNSHIGFKYESVDNWFTVAIDDLEVALPTAGLSPAPDISSQLTLYPNPAKGFITLSGHEALLSFDDIEIVDVTGKVVKQIPFTEHLFVGDLPDGVYSLIIRSPKGTATKKIIVSK